MGSPKKLFLYGHITDEEEKTAVEEHFQLLYKERMLGLAMDWTGPQSSAMVDKKLAFFVCISLEALLLLA